jgi:signal transduction histidine kinase
LCGAYNYNLKSLSTTVVRAMCECDCDWRVCHLRCVCVMQSISFEDRALNLTIAATGSFVTSRQTNSPDIAMVIVLAIVALMMVVAVAFVVVFYRKHVEMLEQEYVREQHKRVVADAARDAHEKTILYASHQLRNPLHAVSGSAAFLLDLVKPGDEMYEDVIVIVSGAAQMSRLISDIMDWGKVSSGEMTLSREPTVLPSLLRDVVRSADALSCAMILCRGHVMDSSGLVR